MPEVLSYAQRKCPIGNVLLAWDKAGCLRLLNFIDGDDNPTDMLKREFGDRPVKKGILPKEIGGAFKAYFDGDPEPLHALPVILSGTDFQRSVWEALNDVGPGETASYLDIARAIGNPKGVRAVGLANGANRIAIRIPCHRIVGANGKLTGYGGGLWRKEWLLNHEKKMRHVRPGEQTEMF